MTTLTWSLALILACLSLSAAAARISPIADTNGEWDKDAAESGIQADIASLLARYTKSRKKNIRILEEFIVHRQKEDGIRKLAKWGKSMGMLLALLPEEALSRYREDIYTNLLEMATLLNRATLTHFSFVENAVMRGWPMYRQPYCKKLVYEAYNFGHIGQAVAMAARATAKRGDHEAAVRLVTPVLEHLWDNFLTKDPNKTKLDSQGRLTLVPPQAPPDRFERYLQVGDYQMCLDQPEMYNHGTSGARAAMEVLHTIDAISAADGWSSLSWPMSECSLKECKMLIGEYVRKNGMWMKGAFQQPPSLTGQDPILDKYPGEYGRPWYTWRYQNTSGCNDPKAGYFDVNGVRTMEFVDRPQDTQHGKEEMAFIVEYMNWESNQSRLKSSGEDLGKTCEQRNNQVKDTYRKIFNVINKLLAIFYRNYQEVSPEAVLNGMLADCATDIFSNEDINRLIVTFLNRVVYDYEAASNNNLFACDVEGTITSTSKSCQNARSISKRSQAAPNWLILAYAARMYGTAWAADTWDSESSRAVRCDVYRMVKTVLPITIDDHERFDKTNFGKVSSDWTADIIMAKYYFYNYEHGLQESCMPHSNKIPS